MFKQVLVGKSASTAVAPTPSRRSVVVRAATALPSDVKTVTPLGDRVLIKAVEPEEITSSGILLPTSAQKRPTQGDVVSTSAAAVPVGERVVYSKYAGTEVEISGAAHILLKQDDVIGMLAPGGDIPSLKPLQDRVLIEVAQAGDTTAGGLLLTEAAKDKPTIGKVIAVGPGRTDDDGKTTAPTVTVGSSVLYSKYSGSEFEGSNGKQYIVVRDIDILATVA